MKRIFLAMTYLFSLAASAQDLQKEKNEAMKDKVIAFFNAQNSDSLYSLAGTAFKKQLSAEKFKAVCDNNLFPLGKIGSAAFEKIEKGVSKYKATFDVAIVSMYLSLDTAGMLETFLFQPYKKEITGEIKKSKTDNRSISELDKKVEAIVQPFMFESKTVGMSIGVLKDRKTYFYNYGETKKGNGQVPASKNLYEIGSITKTFTGILLAKAVIENKIKLSDPVNKYLPKNIPVIKFGNDTLKIVHLSNHTSGLPPLPDNFGATDLVNPYKDYDEKKLLDYLKHATLSRKPGEKLEYCNLGVGLLGYILQQVNKMPFEKMVTDFICTKATMNDTREFLLKKDSSLFMQGYDESIFPQSQWDFKALAAAGCLRSNTEDMLKFAVFNMNTTDNDLQKAIDLSHQPTFEDAQQRIGLNWFIQNWGWGELLFHGGATGGYRSLLVINPKTKNAVVILSNTAVSNDTVGVGILKYIDK
ncbi:serine hydrolase domain-containing protein [Ferruginibacter sp. SUN106]|uniref:serine hydrolase domain-containing protein n=1 Tax=Ferruginibacter sp. SUN106 TaxID=2978348 RepID=UPI003D36DA0F